MPAKSEKTTRTECKDKSANFLFFLASFNLFKENFSPFFCFSVDFVFLLSCINHKRKEMAKGEGWYRITTDKSFIEVIWVFACFKTISPVQTSLDVAGL